MHNSIHNTPRAVVFTIYQINRAETSRRLHATHKGGAKRCKSGTKKRRQRAPGSLLRRLFAHVHVLSRLDRSDPALSVALVLEVVCPLWLCTARLASQFGRAKQTHCVYKEIAPVLELGLEPRRPRDLALDLELPAHSQRLIKGKSRQNNQRTFSSSR